ncbi:MAG: hypothetical protein KDL31_04015 [Kiritimatiellae bacterium]|nr:hypothetical protein [Kiritimatiellia bacterium]
MNGAVKGRTSSLAAGIFILTVMAALAQPGWRDLEPGTFDQTLVHDAARTVLQSDRYRWRHAASDHFIHHFERQMFAVKVARMGEFFYQRITGDFPGLPDSLSAPSHILVFRDEKDWADFLGSYPGAPEWSGSMVAGHVLFLAQQQSISDSGDVLAHEMTHLVLNRLIQGRIPLWLNEGLAEWYGMTLYAEFKGIKRSLSSEFRGEADLLPVSVMWDARTYPEDPLIVRRFYHTAKCMVGLFLTEFPRERMEQLIAALSAGQPVQDAVASVYEWQDAEAVEQALRKRVR